MTAKPEYITVGHFGRPRNLSGEIYITPASDDPHRFLELKTVFITEEGRRKKLQLEKVAMIGNRPAVRIKGINNREDASRLTNKSIEIPFDMARPLPEGSYYQFELIGCRVVGIDGEQFGTVEEVLFYPANDIYRVVSDKYGEVLLPVVDRFILNVDTVKEEILIDPPDGLFGAEKPDSNKANNVEN